jgi:hypothetical protein
MSISIRRLAMFRLAARLMAAAMLIVVLYFLLAYLIGSHESFGHFRNLRELLTFICFPVSSLIGLGMTFRYEWAGALLVLAGLAGLLLLRPELGSNLLMMAPALPACIFLFCSFTPKKTSKRHE